MGETLQEKAPVFDDLSDEDVLEDPTEHDRTVLEEEEQREKLVTESSNRPDGSIANDEGSLGERRRARRKERRRLRKSKRREKGSADEEGKLMYEMEEGGSRGDLSSSSSSSLELDHSKYQSPSINTVCEPFVIRSKLNLMLESQATKKSSQYRHLYGHRGHVSPSRIRIIPDVSQTDLQRFPINFIERHLQIWSYHHPHIARRLPRRLCLSKHNPDFEFLHSQRHLTKIHAPKLSERYLP